jgi:hypothetical protein
MSTGLSAFEEIVLANQGVQAQLLAEPDRARFVALVRDLAHRAGVEVSTEEVEGALVAARRRYLERWV